MSNRQFLYIVIATFLTIITWVVFDILHSQNRVQITPETKQLIEPISPEFDQEVIRDLSI